MPYHLSHKLETYKDDEHHWITYCSVCSREEENLSTPCPGKFVSLTLDEKVDKTTEQD